jgi:hypothetical protein
MPRPYRRGMPSCDEVLAAVVVLPVVLGEPATAGAVTDWLGADAAEVQLRLDALVAEDLVRASVAHLVLLDRGTRRPLCTSYRATA